MNYQRFIYILVLAFFISACTKTIFDKRRKYIGEYEFTIDITCSPNTSSNDTTYTYNGSIDYSVDKEKVIINFEPNYTIEPQIDDDNHLIQHIDHYQGDDLGQFINKNEVEFVIRYGGLGGWCDKNVYGKKK